MNKLPKRQRRSSKETSSRNIFLDDTPSVLTDLLTGMILALVMAVAFIGVVLL